MAHEVAHERVEERGHQDEGGRTEVQVLAEFLRIVHPAVALDATIGAPQDTGSI